jgi:hypothetical protein
MKGCSVRSKVPTFYYAFQVSVFYRSAVFEFQELQTLESRGLRYDTKFFVEELRTAQTSDTKPTVEFTDISNKVSL